VPANNPQSSYNRQSCWVYVWMRCRAAIMVLGSARVPRKQALSIRSRRGKKSATARRRRQHARRVRYPTIFNATRISGTSLVRSSKSFLDSQRSNPFSFVLILISEVSVRCTGHLSAISINLDRCSAVSWPVILISRSIRSIFPSLVSHSAQSAA